MSIRTSGAAISVLACALLASACGSKRDGPSVVLVTLDTTRADALGCYGGRPEITPNLDALAKEAVLYEDARSAAPMTLPSHCSILTGLYPPRHTVRSNGLNPLPAAAVTIAERARESGAQTAAFVSTVVLDRTLGVAQGFELYDSPPLRRDPNAGPVGERSSNETVAAASAWIGARDPSRPFLLWVHLFDPHEPYAPPSPFLRRANGDRYLGEVAAMDDAFGKLIAALRENGALEHTLVVVAGDHGEALGQHGERTHATYCYEETIRVPLLVRYPDRRRAAERSAEVVSLADLAPTILDALGLPALAGLDGVSLYDQRVPDGRGVYFESYYGFLNFHWSPLAGWAERGAKYLHSAKPELYELASDPHEERDLAAERPADVERCRRAIDAALAKPALAREEMGADDALAAGLQNLGYAAGAEVTGDVPHPLAPSDRPSPAECKVELRELFDALELGNQNKLDRAIQKLEALVREHPENNSALNYLSSWLIRQRRFDEAAIHLQRLVAIGAARAMAFNNLGFCLEQRGDLDGALAHYRQAHALDPELGFALENLARMLEARGETEEAARYRQQLAAQNQN